MSVGHTRAQFAVESSAFAPGITLVEASAGTGKTFNIAMSVLRLLFERRADGAPLVDGIGHILVVTFTTAATDELITRIRTLLRHALEVYGDQPTEANAATTQLLYKLAAPHNRAWVRERVAGALADVDALAVYTIHGFCKRILDEFALESGTAFGAGLLEDDRDLLQAALQAWWRTRFYRDAPLAALAVASGWSPDSFVEAYRLWRRYPVATITPDVPFDVARRDVDHALAAFRTAFAEDAFRTYVGGVDWNSKAACRAGEALERIVELAHAAGAGDLGAAKAMAADLNVDALRAVATKRSDKQKQQVEALGDWPIAVAATAVRAAITRLEAALRADCLRTTHAWAESEKRRRNVLAFDDLLAGLHGALMRQGAQGQLARAIRGQFQAALIDEFQDTDSFQFEIFATAFHDTPLFLIGDPKQAIYAFRGADVHAYLRAARTAEPQFTLATNYRSTDAMVQAVNAVFMRRPHPFVDDTIRFAPAVATPQGGAEATLEGKHALHWLFVRPEERKGRPVLTSTTTARRLLFAATVRHIAAQVSAGWQPRSIAVLVRSRHEGVTIADALRACGIPAVVSGLGNVFDSAELLELQLVLEAIATPRHDALVRGAVATHLWGGSAAELLRLSAAGSEAQWDALQSQLTALRELWLTHGVLQLLQELLRQRDVTTRFLAFDDGERRLTNLRHLIELLHSAASTGSLNIEGVLRWIRARRADADRENEVSELRLETDADAVQVYTIHKSKGLQFDLVYCPTLFHGRPVDGKQPQLVHEGDGVVFDHAAPVAPDRVAQAEVERLAEDCRLAYVALTRARFRTYVGWGAIGSMTGGKTNRAANSALGYLLAEHDDVDTMPALNRPEAVAQHYLGDSDRYEQAVRSLVDASDGRMQLEVVESTMVEAPVVAAPRPAGLDPVARALPPDPAPSVRFDTYTISSFTHLSSGGHGAAADAPRDVDDVRITPVRIEDLPAADFRAFPAGRRAGTVLHALFEHSRFDDPPSTLRERATVQLIRNQLAADEEDPRIDATARMMRAVFDTPLAPWPVSLAHVAHDKARHEWQFLLPFSHATRAFTRQAIAACFERHGGADGARYAAQLRQLGGGRVHGYLTGFVDLVFEHRGLWYVVDWKSNQLGGNLAAYDHAALQPVMESSHYTLQYHLYLVALHRHLRIRLPGYDYDRHIGGAAYAFLRGFAEGASESGRGWFTDRPSRALIEALSDVMDARLPEGA